MDVLDCFGLIDLGSIRVQQPGLCEVRFGNLEHGRLFQRIDLHAVGIAGRKSVANDFIIQRNEFIKILF